MNIRLLKLAAPAAAFSILALAGLNASAQAVTTAAPVANPPPATTPPTTANADTGYSGDAHGPAFRDIEDRITALEARSHGNRSAMAMLSKVKGEAKYRRARHGGELRDWDRELLNKQLDQVAAKVGG